MTQVEGAHRALSQGPATMNLIVLAVALFVSGRVHAQESEEAALGTIEVNGSPGAAVPLPKLAVVPLLTSGRADEVVQLVTRGDFALSGQFDVLDESTAPSGPFLIDIPLSLDAWGKVGAEYVVRVYSRSATGVDPRLVGEVYLTQTSRVPTTPAGVPVTATPLFTTTVALIEDARAASHRLVDALLGALTGRPGGFASRMVYVANIGASRRVFELDSDGFDLHAASPPDTTALSPSFGPGDVLFYALSRDLSPFRLATTSRGLPAPVQVPGSLMGLAFSADRKQMALIAMDEGVSTVYLESGGKLRRFAQAPLANHPAFGPSGKLAYVAGRTVQRVYVDRRPVSPPGFMASAPVFCDTPQGLLVFYTVKTRTGSDIVASYPNGQGLHRFTQLQGGKSDPACSPDGRLLAYFSTRSTGKGAGLYIMPIARPWLARKVAGEVGDSLRWEATVAAPAPRPAR